MTKKKILFFTPSAGRTGSEMALWNTLRYAAPSKFDMALSSYVDGALLKLLPLHIPTFRSFYGSLETAPLRRISDSLVAFLTGQHRVYLEWQFFRRLHKNVHPDIWYLNTSVLENPLHFVSQHRIPCILHVHELLEPLYTFSPAHLERLIHYPFLIIACSEAVRRVLRTLGRTERIEVCYPPVDIESLKRTGSGRLKVRHSLGIPDTAFTWVMSGFYSMRKNPTGFLELAERMQERRPDVYFLWIGVNPQIAIAEYLQRRTRELGLDKRVFWCDAKVEEYPDFLDAADGFLLTSLEDPMPLVTVEALSLGKPLVATKCGGIAELVDRNLGILVDRWDPRALIDAMLDVMEGRFAFDQEAAVKQAGLFDARRIAAQWVSIVERYLGNPTPRAANRKPYN